MPRTKKCDAAVRAGRLAKAGSFLDQAEVVLAAADDQVEVADAAVTLLVLAGIAAADVICCARLGEHAQGESHSEAVDLLRTVNKDLAKALQVLLGLKTQAGYSALFTTKPNLVRARRAAERLVDEAKLVS